ncbi:hypothetical protein BMF94_6769 [Rhodotorula taiwanensis]|uniref:Activator of Hsp90 ATPase AHSA1-like N-terminal domain-containing protein n=1 Tax=Rhodotorula taiwanensis TaxID=741276 RepID=A0A2S5B085_9BASI|nr:hypothetical protein BMF94_6769 [Rhodotorula taiwanensis]
MSHLSHGIKHWHWRTKGVEPWAKTWFGERVTGVQADGVEITDLTDTEGTAELGMRKSKLITVYDLRLTMAWKATTKDGEAVTGTLVAPEVGHDMEEDEYVFESSVTAGSGSEADAFARAAKKAVGNKLRPIFQQFPKDMIAVHGKDLLDDSTPTDSGASTPVSASAPAPAVPSGATAPAASSTNAKSTSAFSATTKQSTATVRATGEFQCSADDLFDFLTNPQKIPMWSRNLAQMAPEVGADVSLFGGNIRGKVEKVERPRGFTMTWRAPTWPEDLYGQLEAALDQGSNSTSLSLTLRGVPIGKEDETETNLHTFYIRGLQSIGLGLLSSSTSTDATLASSTGTSTAAKAASSSASGATRSRRKPKGAAQSVSRWHLANMGSIAASAGLLVALGAAFYYGPSGPGGKR